MLGKTKTENYLKAIYLLEQQHGTARQSEIADILEVSRPTVSISMKELIKAGYAEIHPDGSVALTHDGKQIADSVTEKYHFFLWMLRTMQVNEDIAKQDACKLEHSISEESFTAIQRFFEGFSDAKA
jgi:Mn-dependent DtxR family transcriptional regulator